MITIINNSTVVEKYELHYNTNSREMEDKARLRRHAISTLR